MFIEGRLKLKIFVFFSILLTLIIYWFGYGKPTFGIDDANIYFVYMRNFATGHGFVWNISGERVEGFTSLLWTLIGGLFYIMAKGNFVWLLLFFNFLLTYITVHRLLLFVRRINHKTTVGICRSDIVILALLFFPLGYIEWSVLSLMETGLWIFLIVNTTLDLCNYYLMDDGSHPVMFGLGISLIILTRPEGIFYGLLFIFVRFFQRYADTGFKKSFLDIRLPSIFYIITLACLIVWRIYYFGYPLPNTYYAKVSGSMKDNISGGLSYLFKFFYEYPQAAFAVAFLVLAVCFVFFIRKRKYRDFTKFDKIQITLFFIVLSGLGLPVLTGGDHFKFSRFYQCILPLIYLSLFNFPFWTEYFGEINYGKNSRTSAIFTTALVIGIFFIPKADWYDLMTVDKISSDRILGDFQHARNGRASAIAANETFENISRYPSIGILAAGGFGYVYKGDAIDLMGLNSTIMAHANNIKHGFRNHASFDEGAFWKLNPDIVGVFYGGEIVRDTNLFVLPENTLEFRRSAFVYGAYKDIFDHRKFISTYLPALVRNKDFDFYLFAYYRTSFLKKLNREVYEVHLLSRKYMALEN